MSERTCCPVCGKDLYDWIIEDLPTVICPRCDEESKVEELIGSDDDYAYTI